MKSKKVLVRNRRNKAEEKSYLFTAKNDLWRDIEQVAHEADVSIAHFLREAARRNVAAYRKGLVL